MKTSTRIMIIAGEPSGDLHGGHLAIELLKQRSGLQLTGIGGHTMASAGVDLFFDMKEIAVVGITEVLKHFGTIKTAFNLAKDQIIQKKCDAVILIDYPDFNLRLARIAHKHKIKVFYYISPQLWAWRKGRIREIASNVDMMLVILPFEKEFYSRHNVNCTFVGHPLMDETETETETETEKELALLRHLSKPVVALFPGSRKSEVTALLQPMLAAAAEIKQKHSSVSFVLSQAASIDSEIINNILEQYNTGRHSVEITVIKGRPTTILENSNLAIVASGTTTLQAAIANTPMVIVYKLSMLTYLIGRMLVKIDHIGLVNLVAGKKIVPELIQSDVTAEKIADSASKMLSSDISMLKAELEKVREKLGKPGCAEKAARTILMEIKAYNT